MLNVGSTRTSIFQLPNYETFSIHILPKLLSIKFILNYIRDCFNESFKTDKPQGMIIVSLMYPTLHEPNRVT